MLTRSLGLFALIASSVPLIACHDASQLGLVERASPDGGADELDTEGAEGELEAEAPTLEDIVARYDVETQTLAVIDVWQDDVFDRLGLEWTADGWAIIPNLDLTVEVVVLSEDEQPTLVPPQEQEKEGIVVYKNAKCVPMLTADEGPCMTNGEEDEPGTSFRWMANDVNTCIRGHSLCPQYECIHSERHYYSGPNCTGAKVHIHTIPGMTCDL